MRVQNTPPSPGQPAVQAAAAAAAVAATAAAGATAAAPAETPAKDSPIKDQADYAKATKHAEATHGTEKAETAERAALAVALKHLPNVPDTGKTYNIKLDDKQDRNFGHAAVDLGATGKDGKAVKSLMVPGKDDRMVWADNGKSVTKAQWENMSPAQQGRMLEGLSETQKKNALAAMDADAKAPGAPKAADALRPAPDGFKVDAKEDPAPDLFALQQRIKTLEIELQHSEKAVKASHEGTDPELRSRAHAQHAAKQAELTKAHADAAVAIAINAASSKEATQDQVPAEPYKF